MRLLARPFWRRSRDGDTAPVSPGRTSSDQPLGSAELDLLLDTVTSMVREFGRFTLDAEPHDARATQETAEKWAEHLLVGSPPPQSRDERSAIPVRERDWKGVRQWFSAKRRAEHATVSRSHEELRDVIWGFVGTMNRMVLEESDADVRAKTQLDELGAAIKEGGTEDIKRLARSTIDSIGAVLDERRKRYNEQVQELGTKLNSLGAQLETARKESTLDALTQLFNRRAFDEQLGHSVELTRVLREPVCMMLIDVDHFKNINDAFGHTTGDLVLRDLAQLLARFFRRKRDFVARYGGEEFAVILRDIPEAEARAMADKLMTSVRDMRIQHSDGDITLTVSLGMTMLKPDEPGTQWFERADKALYRAKNEGRNRVEAL